MAKKFLLVAKLLFLQAIGVMGFQSCTIEDVTRCIQFLAPFHTSTTIFPSFDDRTLDDLCKSFLEMEACLAPIKPACTHEEVVVYEGLEKASKFLCRDGLEQYRNHRVCFANNALEADGHFCNFTYTKEVELARTNNNKETLEVRTKKLCKDTGKFMACVQKAVKRHCGGGAANWVHSVNLKVFTPFMDSIGCHDHSTSTSRNNVPLAIVLGVALALFAILLSIIITSIICRRRARQNNSISLNRPNTGTSGTVDEKKARSETRSYPTREANIYSTSPKKTCTVNGSIRNTLVDPEDEMLFESDKKKEEDLDEIVLVKSNHLDDTYERIKIMSDSPEICHDENCKNQIADHQCSDDDQRLDQETMDSPIKMMKDERPYLVERSVPTREENEHLLPACDDWKNDSDLDSEGFPPPPPPICESDDDYQSTEGQMRVNIVNPYHSLPHAGEQIWIPRQADVDQTEVKQTVPSGERTKHVGEMVNMNKSGNKRNSNIYEDEVDRLLEMDQIGKIGKSKRKSVNV